MQPLLGATAIQYYASYIFSEAGKQQHFALLHRTHGF